MQNYGGDMGIRRTPATIGDVAARAGVSRATVSYALTRPSRVSAATLEKVSQAIEELGFVVNAAARQLSVGRSKALGLLVSNAANPIFEKVAEGADSEARRSGRFILLANSVDDPQREREYIQFFESYQVSGILIAPVGDVPPELIELGRRGTPFAMIGQPNSPSQYPAISGDNNLGGYLAAQHLVQLGRRRLLVIGGSHPHVDARIAGARRAVAEAGGAVRLEEVRVELQTAEVGARVARQLLDGARENLPDGIFAGNDLLALGLLHELYSSGVAVPNDLSLVGYDDIEFASISIVPLTTIRHPSAALGASAVALLLGEEERMAANEAWDSRFAPELVVRQSSVPLS